MVSVLEEIQPMKLHHYSNLMAEAFFDYPLYTFSIPDDRVRRRALPHLFGALLQYTLKRGKVYTTGHDRAVSLWLPPSMIGISSLEFILSGGSRFVLESGIPAARRLGRLIDQTILNRKKAGKLNCWYLYIIAVDSAAQGQGLGKKLIKGAAASLKPQNGIWLETCRRSNAEIYASLGFKFCHIEKIQGTPIQTHGMFAEITDFR